MLIDRPGNTRPSANSLASPEQRVAGGSCKPEMPSVPPRLREALVPEERLYFTDTSYYAAERWKPYALDAGQAREARILLRKMDGILRPADSGWLLTRILALLSHYRSDPNPPEVEYMLAQDWVEDLGEFPDWAIDGAAREWRRSRKFRPQICEIRSSCQRIAGRAMKLRDRLSALLADYDASAPATGNRVSGIVGGVTSALAMRSP